MVARRFDEILKARLGEMNYGILTGVHRDDNARRARGETLIRHMSKDEEDSMDEALRLEGCDPDSPTAVVLGSFARDSWMRSATGQIFTAKFLVAAAAG
jgi:hypothetical protein